MISWEELPRSMTKVTLRRFRPADDKALDALEVTIGLALPRSYREFVKIFGACNIGHKGICIAGPRHKATLGPRSDLAALNEETHEIVVAGCGSSDRTGRGVQRQRALRLVFFADNYLDDTFGWDPEDISDTANHEYAVYSRYTEAKRYPRIASSFADFVLRYCLGADLKRWDKAGRPVGNRKSFDCERRIDPRLFISPL